MYWTLGQAAKETGHDKSKIYRAIKSGKLSVAERNGNAFKLDASEVMRLFPKNETLQQTDTQENTIENRLLTQKVEFLEQQIAALKTESDRTEKRLEASEAERREMLEIINRQTLLLTSAVPAKATEEKPTRSWFQRMFKS